MYIHHVVICIRIQISTYVCMHMYTYGSRLTGLTCSKAPGFWMVEHQLALIVFPTLRLCTFIQTSNN